MAFTVKCDSNCYSIMFSVRMLKILLRTVLQIVILICKILHA